MVAEKELADFVIAGDSNFFKEKPLEGHLAGGFKISMDADSGLFLGEEVNNPFKPVGG